MRVGNYTQISRKSMIISGTAEVVNKAGRGSELAYQAAKKGNELLRDIEAILSGNQASVAPASGSPVASSRTTPTTLAGGA